MVSYSGQARIARRLSGQRRREDARQQRRTIMVDEDADWLINTIEFVGNADVSVALPRAMRFNYLPEGSEVVLSQSSESGELISVHMPQGSQVARVRGSDYDSWVFCVTDGARRMEVTFRGLETGDYLLYLQARVGMSASS